MSSSKRYMVIVLIFVALFSMGISYSYAGNCEIALFRCLEDAIILGSAWHLYCLNGYLLCLKYIRI